MRAFDLVGDALADVVQQTGPASHVDVGAELGSHHPAEMGNLDRMLEDVLPHAESEVQPAKSLDQIRIQSRYAGLEGRPLAFLADHGVNFGLRPLDHLLDARGVNAAVD